MKQLSIFFATLLLLIPTGAVRGEPLVALTVTNELVRFDSATPGTVVTTPITGLVSGDALLGIDLRPSNNVLYGFATDSGEGGANMGVGKIYSIDVITGLATVASTLSLDPGDMADPSPFSSVEGTFFGVDFNPVVDLLRVVSDTGQNLRINVDSGLTQLDVPLAYAAGDDNNGSPPMVVASAYSNNLDGAGSTTLFNLDAALSTLVDQTPANDGTLNTVDITSRVVFADASFDISGATGIGYAVLDGITLSTIDLDTGEVTEVGFIDTVGAINGLAVLIPEPASLILAVMAGCGCLAIRRNNRLRKTG